MKAKIKKKTTKFPESHLKEIIFIENPLVINVSNMNFRHFFTRWFAEFLLIT